MTVRPRYPEVFDICGDRAAVRFGNNRAGVVNETGQPGIQLDRCRKMKFMKGDLLAVTDCAGNESYIDLKVNRTYREKPVVLSFGCMELPYGGVELLKVGTFFFSRTGKPYVSMRGVDQNGIYFYDFYLKIPDYRVPKDCHWWILSGLPCLMFSPVCWQGMRRKCIGAVAVWRTGASW